jgi:peptidoglycan/xylan/chitin deacetylase (PgdA/CDA1 family)
MKDQNDRLTVFCYHRVGDPDRDGPNSYRPNFSASIQEFSWQMKFIKACFTPVSLREIVLWLKGGASLPKRPALITFDDGYRDNGYVAWPIMRDLGIPGVIFLATEYIGTGKPFLWDYAAGCFQTSKVTQVCVPLLGEKRLLSLKERHAATLDWVDASKRLPDEERWVAAEMLASALDVPPMQSSSSDLCLTWDEVRRLSSEGLEFGGHTCSHPILTQLSEVASRVEIIECQERLISELGYSATGFAYPNGSAKDYDQTHERAASEAGFDVAFTLEPGPARLSEIVRNPFAVRRIYVGPKDNSPRFTAKAVGAARLAATWWG